MIHTIKSDILQVDINSVGAELSSIYSVQMDREYLWQGDSAWWTGRAPILFPIVCSMKDNAYLYNDKTYEMPKHGFVRRAEFVAKEVNDSKIIFEYRDNEETQKLYPFAFLLQVTFELVGNTLSTTYRVENHNSNPMYFSIGAHEAYNCPLESEEDFEDYYLEFEKDGTYISETLTDLGLLNGETYNVIENDHIIPLMQKWFDNDNTLIFKNVPSSRVFLKSKKSTTAVEIDYQNAPHLGVWKKTGAPYLCIEPWYGLPDYVDHDGNIKNKCGIVTLDANSDFTWTHNIIIHE